MRDIRLHSKENSWCLMCGRIHYGRRLERCPRCGGVCTVRKDDDLALMARSGMRHVENSR